MNNSIAQIRSINEVTELVQLVKAFHRETNIHCNENNLKQILENIISNDKIGKIWFIRHKLINAGYIAVSFGFSLEFGGFDAFVDEFFIQPAYRGFGLGREALEQVKSDLQTLGLSALHLEVSKTETGVISFYEKHQFKIRQNYHLMSAKLITDKVE